jgi:hypothetical protein
MGPLRSGPAGWPPPIPPPRWAKAVAIEKVKASDRVKSRDCFIVVVWFERLRRLGSRKVRVVQQKGRARSGVAVTFVQWVSSEKLKPARWPE